MNTETKKRVEELAQTYDWIKIAPDGVPELYCDHHILSTMRLCEAKFQEEIINNWVPRSGNWALSFGVAFHKWMEWFDEAEDKGFIGHWNDSFIYPTNNGGDDSSRINLPSWIYRCKQYWKENNLDSYKDADGFKELEGWTGAQVLLLEYWNYYGSGRERLRTVGSEIGFGKDKEVPIISDSTRYEWAPFRAYLTGRIDRVVDNGKAIGPMDRKTHRYFKGDELSKYKPHDGMLGYIFAINTILGEKFSREGKSCNSVIIDLVALREVKTKTAKNYGQPRFRRVARDFANSELLAFKERQVSSFARLWDLLVEQRPFQWNTQACHNQYYKPCPYRLLHEASEAARKDILNTFYQQREQRWNPYRDEQEQQMQESVQD